MPVEDSAGAEAGPHYFVRDSYDFNTELEDTLEADVRETSRTILVYEDKNKTFEFRHINNTMTNIAFVDGHVKAFTKENLEAALKNGTVRWRP